MLAHSPLVIEYDPDKTGRVLKFHIGFTRALDSYTGWFNLKVNGKEYESIPLLREDPRRQQHGQDVF